jgi:adenylate cyclase
MKEKLLNLFKKFFTGNGVVLIILAVMLVIRVADPWPTQVLRLKSFDFMQTRADKVDAEDVIIVDIDEKSVEKYGQWPYDRKDLAGIIDKLRANGAGIIVIPALFSEPDRARGDDDFAKKLKNNGVVIAQQVTNQNKKPDAQRRGVAKIGGDPTPHLYRWNGALKPLDKLASSADGVGVIAAAPEPDGVVRRMPMLVTLGTGDEIYPSLVLEALRVSTGDPSYQVKTSEAGVEAVRVPQYGAITTDQTGSVWLSWNYNTPRVSVTGDLKQVKNKVVVLGLTIEGVGGVIATPTGSAYAHDMQANAIQTVIDKTVIQRFSWAGVIELATIVIVGLAFVYFMPKIPLAFTVPVIILYVVTEYYLATWLFTSNHQLWDWTWPVLTIFLMWSYTVFNKFAKENALKKQIKKQFEHYLSPDFIKELQKNPGMLKLGGDTRKLSILFSDIRGFTTISEYYKTNPQGLTRLINRYMTPMTATIMERKGTIDKYIGDAIMAFWGAPLDVPDQADLAVEASMDMVNRLNALNEELRKEGIPELGMGVGINTGEVVVGNMGSDQRFDYTCLGDAVNLSSRLEGQSKPYGVQLVVGQETEKLLSRLWAILELDCIAVKGKAEGINIYTVIGKTMDINSFDSDKETHDEMIRAYRKQQWPKAIKLCKGLEGKFDGKMDKYYHAILERIEELKTAELPADWDGVYRATSK